MSAEANPHEVAIITHVLVPVFSSLSPDAQVVAVQKMLQQAAYYGFQKPYPDFVERWMKECLEQDAMLKDGDRVAEELFSPPKTELDV